MQQERLLPAHLPDEALLLEDLPWSDPFSVQSQIKRAADVSVALVLLLVCLPLIVIAAVLIWLEDRGPVFYTQNRCGLLGCVFRAYKLRTMIASATGEPARWTQPGDQRITRIG